MVRLNGYPSGLLLLFTHKLTVQLLWFLVPFLAVVEGSLQWLWPLILSYVSALVVGRDLFLKILRQHWDIVSFWHRNWNYLGAHQIRNSPIYGDGTPPKSGYHSDSYWRSCFMHGKRSLKTNLWIITALMAAWSQHLSDFESFLLVCVVGTYLWVFLTSCIPALRLLGEGIKYVKFAIPPSIALTFGPLLHGGFPQDIPIVMGLSALQLFALVMITRNMNRSFVLGGAMKAEMANILERIRLEKEARILCLPTHLADLVAFHTDSPVLWGGHGYGFAALEPFFPVMRRPVEYFVNTGVSI